MINLYPEKKEDLKTYRLVFRKIMLGFFLLQILFLASLFLWGVWQHHRFLAKKAWVNSELAALQIAQAPLVTMMKNQAIYLRDFSLAQKIYDQNAVLLTWLSSLSGFSVVSLDLQKCKATLEIVASDTSSETALEALNLKNKTMDVDHNAEGVLYKIQGGLYACHA